MAAKTSVEQAFYQKMKASIAVVLREERLRRCDFSVDEQSSPTLTQSSLKFTTKVRPVIEQIKRASRPSLASYKGTERYLKVESRPWLLPINPLPLKAVVTDRARLAAAVRYRWRSKSAQYSRS